MSTAPVRTHSAKRGDVESREKAREAVQFAESEVLRAEKRCDNVERTYRDLLEASHSWLAETQRRLRCATMIARRLEPEVRSEPTAPPPWLPDTTPTLLNWRDAITVDPDPLSDD